MPGRPPTPTEILSAKGTLRPDRHGDRPRAKVERPDRPTVLTGEAAAEWDRVTEQLEVMGMLARIDRGLIAPYCTAWARFVLAEQRIAEAEARRASAKGKAADALDKHLWRLEIGWARAFDRILKAADRLGIGPAARARVKVAPPEKVSSLAEFMNREKYA